MSNQAVHKEIYSLITNGSFEGFVWTRQIIAVHNSNPDQSPELTHSRQQYYMSVCKCRTKVYHIFLFCNSSTQSVERMVIYV